MLELLHFKLAQAVRTNELNLTNFQLTEEHLEYLGQNIKTLAALNSVILKNCNLTAFPHFLNQCSQLKVINLSDNKIKNIPIPLKHFGNVIALNLSNNPISALHGLELCHSLWILILNDTNINYIPKEWKHLKINTLELDNHKLVSPETALLNLPSVLSELTLSNGTFKKGIFELGHLKNLVSLNISGNNINEIDKGIANAKHLVHLNLSGNSLSYLPDNMSKLFILKSIDCSYNHFKKIPSFIRNFSHLEFFDFSNNPLSKEINLKSSVNFIHI
jgi:Leucine-rich repeat (LRR) protein